MLIPSDWRLVAEGNAHLVYRYVGPPTGYFSGMVLKLPKNTTEHEDRLLHQHKFVQQIVLGDQFCQKQYKNEETDPGHYFDNNISSISERIDSFDDVPPSDRSTSHLKDLTKIKEQYHHPPYTINEKNFVHMSHKRSSTKLFNINSSLYPIPSEQTTDNISIDLQPASSELLIKKTHATESLNHRLNKLEGLYKEVKYARQCLLDRGLLSPVHIPAQQLHLFENRHTIKLREQAGNDAFSQTSSFQHIINENTLQPVTYQCRSNYLADHYMIVHPDFNTLLCRQKENLHQYMKQCLLYVFKSTYVMSNAYHLEEFIKHWIIRDTRLCIKQDSHIFIPYDYLISNLLSPLFFCDMDSMMHHSIDSQLNNIILQYYQDILIKRHIQLSHINVSLSYKTLLYYYPHLLYLFQYFIKQFHSYPYTLCDTTNNHCECSTDQSIHTEDKQYYFRQQQQQQQQTLFDSMTDSNYSVISYISCLINQGLSGIISIQHFLFFLLTQRLYCDTLIQTRPILKELNTYQQSSTDDMRSSFALLEKDLVTPPVEPDQLVSLSIINDVENSSFKKTGGWMYYTCELKPKTGLPALVNLSSISNELNDLKHHYTYIDDFMTEQFISNTYSHLSRFTMQQEYKLKNHLIQQRSLYSPELFFCQLNSRQMIFKHLQSLVQQPQNNFRLFIDGVRMIWSNDQHQHKQQQDSHTTSYSSTCLNNQENVVTNHSGCHTDSCVIQLYQQHSHIFMNHLLSLRPITRRQKKLNLFKLLQRYYRLQYNILPIDSDYMIGPVSFLLAWNYRSILYGDKYLTQQSVSQPLTTVRYVLTQESEKRHNFFKTTKHLTTQHTTTNKQQTVLHHEQHHHTHYPINIQSYNSPTEIIFGLNDQLPLHSIVTLTELFSEVIYQENNLFHRLLYIHGLCEGQQDLASKLLNYLIDIRWFYNQETNTIKESSNQSSSFNTKDTLFNHPSQLLSIFHLTTQTLNESTRHQQNHQQKHSTYPLPASMNDRIVSTSENCHTYKKKRPFYKKISELDRSKIDCCLMADVHAIPALQEFLEGIESEIEDNHLWMSTHDLLSTPPNESNNYCPDAEMLLAQRIQKWHFLKGIELWTLCQSYQDTNEPFPVYIAQKIIYWIYRFLIGRTFLDCSVMLNVAVSINDHVKEEDVSHLIENRFVKLCDIPQSQLIQRESHETNASDTSIPLNPTPFPTVHTETLNAITAALSRLRHPILEQKANCTFEHLPFPISSGIMRSEASSYKWLPLQHVLKLKSNEVTYSKDLESPTITVWYRLSVVDLDLKQASKIPHWANQLNEILHIYHSVQDSK